MKCYTVTNPRHGILALPRMFTRSVATTAVSRALPSCAPPHAVLPLPSRFPQGIKREPGARELSRHSGAAPATVSGERRSITPLGLPGKAERRDDPRARRPADIVRQCNRAGCPGRSSDDGRSPVRRVRVARSKRRRDTGRSPSVEGRRRMDAGTGLARADRARDTTPQHEIRAEGCRRSFPALASCDRALLPAPSPRLLRPQAGLSRFQPLEMPS